MTTPVGPIDASKTPRFAGPASFARLPRLDQVPRADIAVVGVPFDSGVSYRPGARFGPRTCGRPPGCCGPYHPALDVSPFEIAQVVDAGDIAVNPFNIHEAIETIEAAAVDLTRDGTSLVTIGGDHTIALPLLRAAARQARARRAGALRRAPGHLGHVLRCRVHPRHPVPPRRRGGHSRHRGAVARRHPRPAVRQEGPRGRPPLRIRHRHLRPTCTTRECARSSTSCATGSATGRCTCPIDIDVLDPAHAPGTGTPEAGGMTSRELLEILRGFRGPEPGRRRRRRGRARLRPRRDHRRRRLARRLRPGVAAGDATPRTVMSATGNGGDVVVETLGVLGVSHVFGIPGQNALGTVRRDPAQRPDVRQLSGREQLGLRRRRVRQGHR